MLGVVVSALVGCGGDDGAGSSAGGGTTPPARADAGPTPTLDAVLACMRNKGLDAREESASKIAVDYPRGQLVVSFEDSEEAANTAARVAGAREPRGTAVPKGTVVITAPADFDASEAHPLAEGCVDST